MAEGSTRGTVMAATDAVCARAVRGDAKESRRRSAIRSGAWLARGGCLMLCVPMRRWLGLRVGVVGDARPEKPTPNFTSRVFIAGYYFRYGVMLVTAGWGALFGACSLAFVERRLLGLSGRGRCVRLRS